MVIAGLILCAIGGAAMAGWLGPLADYTYPIVWWGLLLIVDEWNARSGRSLWRGRLRHFLLITLPISVLFWLLFELLNLASPQWRYRGDITGVTAQVLFGFVAFATVIPIMVEAIWICMGPFCLPAAVARVLEQWKPACTAIAIVLLAVPAFNPVFWFNQGMWFAPALLLLPWLREPRCASPGPFLGGIVAGGLLAGFFWELINFGARTHWEYLILPHIAHLFRMPLPGYLGFIPFGVSAIAVHEAQAHIKARVTTAALLYLAAFGGLYALTVVYIQRSLWMGI